MCHCAFTACYFIRLSFELLCPSASKREAEAATHNIWWPPHNESVHYLGWVENWKACHEMFWAWGWNMILWSFFVPLAFLHLIRIGDISVRSTGERWKLVLTNRRVAKQLRNTTPVNHQITHHICSDRNCDLLWSNYTWIFQICKCYVNELHI